MLTIRSLHRPRPAAALVLCAASCASASPLYSNASSNPAVPALGPTSVSLSGVPAPAGFDWSEAPSALGDANAVAGFSAHATGESGAFRLADDALVVPPFAWRINALTVYAYQPGYSGSTSPVAAMNVRIWRGAPGAPGSAVVWGNAITSVLSSAVPTTHYRVFNSIAAPFPIAPDTSRRLWAITANLAGVTLQPGMYWFDWQLIPADPNASLCCPAVTVPGARSVTGWNARVFRNPPGGAWFPILDEGKPASATDVPQDLPFLLDGVQVPYSCPGDTNGDRMVNFQDLNIVLGQFGQTGPGLSGDVNGDGVVNFIDLNIVLSNFGGSC